MGAVTVPGYPHAVADDDLIPGSFLELQTPTERRVQYFSRLERHGVHAAADSVDKSLQRSDSRGK